jgi:hypothetical protein
MNHSPCLSSLIDAITNIILLSLDIKAVTNDL